MAAICVALAPFGCAQGDAPAIDDLDGGAVEAGDASKDAKDAGHDCPSTCTEATPYCDKATGKCVACLPTHDTCPVTTYCQAQPGGGYKCAVGCKTDTIDCPGAGEGGAGNIACCDHACVDTQSSLFNCGYCGKHCGSVHLTGPSCNFGACDGTCDFGYGDCNGDKSVDGCETNIGTDVNNCGACGHVCATAAHLTNPTCTNGQCGGTCEVGWGDCNGNPNDGCEQQLNTNTHCGTCTTVCSTLPHTTGGACVVPDAGTASCDYAACTTGYLDCDMVHSNGCECGTLPNTTAPACNGTMCDYTTCTTGYADCDSNRGNGCECHPLNTNTAMCTGSNCDYGTCNTNFQDCDGNRANGCESNKLGDSNNCNGCGNRCPTNQGCVNGACVPATGTVTDVMGVVHPIMMVPCGNGTLSNCTQAVAESSCTAIGRKVVSHASDGTTGVISLGATVSCEWSVGYFVNSSQALAGQCLIGLSNASWTQCCGLTMWHGNILTIPTTLGQQFGYIYSTEIGYSSSMTNQTGLTWGCIAKTSAPSVTGSCSVYNVACE